MTLPCIGGLMSKRALALWRQASAITYCTKDSALMDAEASGRVPGDESLRVLSNQGDGGQDKAH